jgi:hypothetical protein
MTGYPTSKLLSGDLRAFYTQGANHVHGLREVANAAIKHSIDSGQLAPKEAYLRCNAELAHAENILESLGYRRADDGTWNEPARRKA